VTDPFVGEIRIFAGNFAPTGWALCNGQLLPISQNTALFSLLGTYYGGDGRSTFALPDLQGRIPVATGSPNVLTQYSNGDTAGADQVTLTATQLPAHTHQPSGVVAAGSVASPAGAHWAEPHYGRALDQVYAPSTGAKQPMGFAAVGIAGSGVPHDNMSPFLVLTFIIAMQGIFPPRQ
jgi:microcystin-dependent protein